MRQDKDRSGKWTLTHHGDAILKWVPLTRTALPPDELMTRCRDRLAQVPDRNDCERLVVVTQISDGLTFPGKRLLNPFGGADAMIESPVLDEVKSLIRVRTIRESILGTIESRFGAIPGERVAQLHSVSDEARLKELVRLAATCPDLDTFVAGLGTK